MARPWRYSLGTVLLVMALVGVAIAGWTKAERLRTERDELASLVQIPAPSPHDAYLRGMPLTILMSDKGGWRANINWYASVDFAGEGVVKIGGVRSVEQVKFTIPAPKLAQLREALITEQFFDLPNNVGDVVANGSEEVLTIIVGDRSKTVRLHYFSGMANAPARYPLSERQEATRAPRARLHTRDFVTHPRAFDGRKYAMNALSKLDAAAAQPAVPAAISAGSTDE